MTASIPSPIISASIMTANILRLEEEVKAVDAAGADWIHIDIMDGKFVPNFGFSQQIVETIRSITHKPLDVHLMVTDPEKHIESFTQAGADIISVHAETTLNLSSIFRQIQGSGKKAGVVLNPDTPLERLQPVLANCDVITLMSVLPGFTGQPFIPRILSKIRTLRQRCDASGLNPFIEVDGGIRLHNVTQVIEAGANAIVVGSVVFKADNYAKAINSLRGYRCHPIPIESASFGTTTHYRSA